MTGSWLLCVTASAILSVCIVAARGETCAPPNVPRVVLTMDEHHGPLICRPEGLCWYASDSSYSNWTKVVCLSPAQEAEAEARGK